MVEASKTVLRVLAVGAAVAASSISAGAQTKDVTPLPSYAVPGYGAGLETIRGTIARLDGKYHLYLRDVRGFVDDVTLNGNTSVSPNGLRLEEGMQITIAGRVRGKTFAADRIDTADYAAAPALSPPPAWYYGPPWYWGGASAYGAPSYGYPPYGYAPYGYTPWYPSAYYGYSTSFFFAPRYGCCFRFHRHGFPGNHFFGNHFFGNPFLGNRFFGLRSYGARSYAARARPRVMR